MHFLIVQCQYGHKLIRYSNAVFDLKDTLSTLQSGDATNVPMILDEKCVHSTYLCNDHGIPVQELDGYLIPLANL